MTAHKITALCRLCGEPWLTRSTSRAEFCSQKCVSIARVIAKQAERRQWERSYSKDHQPPHGARWLSISSHVYTLVDEDLFEVLSKTLWNLSTRGYVSRSYPKIKGEGHNAYLHHLVVGGRPPKGYDADHINRDQLDNRRENLRITTHSRNCSNESMKSHNTSGYRGVDRAYNKWRARITVDGERKMLGFFGSAEEAARAYDDAARRLLDGFARLNFPNEVIQ